MKKYILMIALGIITGAAISQETKTNILKSQEVKLTLEEMQEYKGSYELMPNFNLEFTVQGGKLMSQATGQPAYELTAKGDHVFVPNAFPAKITFVPSEDGAFDHILLEQGGQEIKAERVE